MNAPVVRTWGFRWSVVDLAVLALAVPATWFLCLAIGPIGGVVAFAVGHFFLFCNIFRIHRTKELIWAGLAILNIAAWAAADRLDWQWILLVQSPATIAAILLEMIGPWYHGVFADRFNRRLPDYLAGFLDRPTVENAP